MKKLIALALCMLLAFSVLVACGPDDPAPVPAPAVPATPDGGDATDPAPTPEPATPVDPDRQLTVAGVVFQEDQFMRLLTLGFQDVAEREGARFVPGNTNGDAAVEAEMIQTYLTQEFDGLAISPISEIASFEILRDAAERGLNIGISNHLVEEAFTVGSFSSDNYTLGNSVGNAAKAFIESELDGVANIGILQFQTLLPEQSGARVSGFLDVVTQLPGVTIVADHDAWMQDVAITVGSDMLTANPDIDIIFSANEGGTIGATMAVQNIGLAGSVFVFGFDGSEQMVDLLRDPSNVLQASIAQDPFEIGVLTMEAVIAAARGEDVSSTAGQAFVVPGILLERANPGGLDDFVNDLREKVG